MKNKNGFTLIEILIVFILFGIIASIVTSASRLVANKTANSQMTYTIFTGLKKGVGEYIAEKGLIESSADLCTALADSFNTIGTINCPATEHDIDASTPNFTIKNGAVFYNFGSTSTTSNGSTYYTIYVDIDGPNRRSGTLNDDLISFIINKYGEVLPTGVASTNSQYLTAGYKYLKTVTEPGGQKVSSWEWANTNLPYKEAICKSGIKLQTKGYCSNASNEAVDSSHCGTTPCQIYLYH